MSENAIDSDNISKPAPDLRSPCKTGSRLVERVTGA
jgi:hypothetical protein